MTLTPHDILYYQNRAAYMRDEEAFKKLFLHFHPSILRFAQHLVHHTETAEDIISDIMMKLWEMESRLAQVENLKVYLFTAVRNSAFTYLSKKKYAYDSIDEANEDLLTDESCNPEIIFVQSEIKQKIDEAVKSLPTQCQHVFRLIKEEGLSHREVTGILGITQNTIETQMRIALKKIRLALAGYLREKK